MKRIVGWLVGTLAVGLGVGCSGSGGNDQIFSSGGSGNGSGTGGASGSGTGGTPGSGGSGAIPSIDAGNSGGSGNGPAACDDQGVPDFDGDGFAVADGDCNNCDANANPGALDTIGNNVDEDCNGTPDDTVVLCDSAIPDVGYTDPMAAAHAMGLCHVATAGDKKWGVISAQYVLANGSGSPNPLSHGLLTAFGSAVNVQEGARMLALSSGTGRQPTDPGYQPVSGADMGTTSPPPNGFPVDSPSCSVFTQGSPANDPIGLLLTIRAPTNAKSFKFNLNFYTFEFPGWICTQYNDFFVALQNPAPANAQLGNISFDIQGNPIGVNSGFLEVCTAQTAGGKNFPCQRGPGELAGTGFENHAATGWLETQSPVAPGSEFTMFFAIWDSGDHILDSTVLIDNFQFSADDATGAGTKPVPVPQ